jgi:hypothetical protein
MQSRKLYPLRTLLACAVLLSPAFAAEPPTPDIVLDGTITRADLHTYRNVPFTVPPGTSRLTIEFSYGERQQHTVIDLGLFDPHRFRGWSGGNKQRFTLSTTDATPSYLPGPLPPGTWNLILGIPNIREGVRASFQAKVYLQREGPLPDLTEDGTPLRTKAGWYRGELHAHSGHSDGSCRSQAGKSVPCPVFRTLEAAAARGLDFLAVADHNSISQYQELRELQPYFDHLLLIPAREITTFQGHANVYGTADFIDFRLGSPSVPTIKTLLDRVAGLGALISINHPALPSDESCMGCGWEVPDTPFARIQGVETVNDGDDGAGVRFWDTQLNRGFRLTALGGSDNHHPDDRQSSASVGHPTTVVWAENLSGKAILDGIRAGRVFIDLAGTADRIVDLTARAGDREATMGGTINAPQGTAAHFTVRVEHASECRLVVVEDGRAIEVLTDPAIQGDKEVKEFTLPADGRRHWVRAEVRSVDGKLLLLSNPVYLR